MIIFIRILLIIGILVLSLWKIYIANQIYLLSAKIDQNLKLYYTLRAENLWLRSEVEKMKFYNRTKELW
ncbi:MAG: hypothetical protein C6I01_06810 [Epsilonproteobacteria bacterium]|nr:hypothetical protein [Campylobacterota bacterium]NPA89102.1 hypothetical protein [Campylobacterota bacterium]